MNSSLNHIAFGTPTTTICLYTYCDHAPIVDQSSQAPANNLSLNEKYFLGFQDSIKASAPFSKRVSDYAHELSITPVHLNRICQSVVGKTASWLIQEHAVREAQKP